MESPNKGHFGTNINSSGLSTIYRDCPLLRDSNRIILIGGLKFGDLFLSIVERYLIPCPLFGVSVKRDSTVYSVSDHIYRHSMFCIISTYCLLQFNLIEHRVYSGTPHTYFLFHPSFTVRYLLVVPHRASSSQHSRYFHGHLHKL